ncbi:STAS domain-containing protein [Actinacidiphila paucisporea]|uniref:Anti-anti-sigma factor n=1 Tax=Actinacidiphila paucisporea TaxID=310782 RepID=A0A1M7QAM1_9ACTN|nr:STAS domain-containing protein [Actinacidiphila paucisporea]SHN27745.1 anti-anti-sigma factor [Actinacidiphila paucisporea]
MMSAPDSGEARVLLDLRRLADRPGLSATGEVSLSTRPAWQSALEEMLVQGSDIYLDLSGLSFVDVGGAGALARAAQRLPAPGRIVLSGPPASLRRTLDLFWPDLEAIEVTK